MGNLMRNSSLSTAALLVLIFASFQETSANRQEPYRHGIEYLTLGYQYDMINILVDNRVPFIIDDEGVIRVEQRFRDAAIELEKKIETRPSTIISEPRHVSLLVLLLEQEGIKYHIRLDENASDTHVIWNIEDNNVVQQILQTSFQQAIKSGYRTGILGTYSP
jgi:hypothetical protein